MKTTIKNAVIWKTGNSSVITIPNDFIVNDQLNLGKKYLVIIEDQEENE